MASDVDITKHNGLARLVAKRYSWATASSAIDQEDLVQSAYEGLCRARQTYDPRRSGFGYYGGQWALAHVTREVCKMVTTIAVGPRQRAKMSASGEDDVLYRMVRLDAPSAGSDRGDTHEVIASEGDTPEDDAQASKMAAAVRKAYASMTPRHRLVLRLVVVDELTLEKACKRLGVTREGARQTLLRAKEAMRDALTQALR